MLPFQKSSLNPVTQVTFISFLKNFLPLSFAVFPGFFLSVFLHLLTEGRPSVSCLLLYSWLLEKGPAKPVSIGVNRYDSVRTLNSFYFSYCHFSRKCPYFLNKNLVYTDNLDNSQVIFLWILIPREKKIHRHIINILH